MLKGRKESRTPAEVETSSLSQILIEQSMDNLHENNIYIFIYGNN